MGSCTSKIITNLDLVHEQLKDLDVALQRGTVKINEIAQALSKLYDNYDNIKPETKVIFDRLTKQVLDEALDEI